MILQEPILSIKTKEDSSNYLCGHYDFEWDYQIHESWKLELELATVLKKIKEQVLPNINWANNFIISNLDMDDVGVYISGTKYHPHIGINLNKIKEEAAPHSYEKEIFVTILHELYHSYQESKGYPMDCDFAEAFAIAWWNRIR